MKSWQRWTPDAIVGVVVLLAGLAQIRGNVYFGLDAAPIAVVVGIAAAAGLFRAAPGVALAIAWCVGAVQVTTGTYMMLVEGAFALVAFGCARWGSAATVWLSGLSIPASTAIALWWLDSDVLLYTLDQVRLQSLVDLARRTDSWRPTVGFLLFALLLAPWLLGLVLRFFARSEDSRRSQAAAEAERDQAEEIARLREQQAQLARDVHDVVGHSLAVILAQAESAQYLDEVDTQGLKRTMANIATSARTSLDDVRQVLTTTSGDTAQRARHADLDSLVEGVRASGHEVLSHEVGVSHPLPPELEVVAFRVLQEMLTNAIKHGRRDQPIRVERHWEGDLRIEVENAVDDAPEETQPLQLQSQVAPGGQGIDGMQRRLQAVGGRLDVRRRLEPPTFTATAWVPLRAQA
ncbi:sensor histidine kinase [Nocardioides sp. URHA0032]|uniref:sensor histidine kinase n=1 Tax=Nocardioides sp. URHA0032 TaxID=1380388 RepID=UPI0006842F9C|nr:histidine kinase [Nocardioides sp. URHA0032]